MPEPTVIRFEATEIEADLTGDIGILLMKTQEGRVAVHMHRCVFAALCEQMRHALAEEVKNDQPQKDA